MQELSSKRIRIITFFPPGNHSSDLKSKANKTFKLENHEFKFKSSQLPNKIELEDGFVLKKPDKWC